MVSECRKHEMSESPSLLDPGAAFTTLSLPTLPTIKSRQIRAQVFAHNSLATGHRDKFQASPSDLGSHNERLGQIGDQVIGLAVTDLIQELYPSLRVGPSSKARDRIKCKNVLAEISVLYGLHEKINVPGDQAHHLKALPSVRMFVFKAFVGGLYKDQGLEVVHEWLTLLFRPYVKAAYGAVREQYLLPPVTEGTTQSAELTADHPPLPSPHSAHTLPSGPEKDRGQPSRSAEAQANRSQNESGQESGGGGARSEAVGQSDDSHLRRLASPTRGGRRDEAGTSLRRRSSTEPEVTQSAKRARVGLLPVERRKHRRRTQRGEREEEYSSSSEFLFESPPAVTDVYDHDSDAPDTSPMVQSNAMASATTCLFCSAVATATAVGYDFDTRLASLPRPTDGPISTMRLWTIQRASTPHTRPPKSTSNILPSKGGSYTGQFRKFSGVFKEFTSFHPPTSIRDFHSHYSNEYHYPTHLEQWKWDTWEEESRARQQDQIAHAPASHPAMLPESELHPVVDAPAETQDIPPIR
ncbi:hypothetical protein BGW80DRAFT_1464226 [Lactifluus volemus]|nr:hypothetical protein BGW80DRAFT_1464226 [Lactifluus volemus]